MVFIWSELKGWRLFLVAVEEITKKFEIFPRSCAVAGHEAILAGFGMGRQMIFDLLPGHPTADLIEGRGEGAAIPLELMTALAAKRMEQAPGFRLGGIFRPQPGRIQEQAEYQ
jgi:hypothetical protein